MCECDCCVDRALLRHGFARCLGLPWSPDEGDGRLVAGLSRDEVVDRLARMFAREAIEIEGLRSLLGEPIDRRTLVDGHVFAQCLGKARIENNELRKELGKAHEAAQLERRARAELEDLVRQVYRALTRWPHPAAAVIDEQLERRLQAV